MVAIVNRRQSDLTDKADGVLYTSDGRDVEMSVASTKAFYAQIAAGFLLAWAIAEEVGGTVDRALVEGLRALPVALEETIARRAVDRGGGAAARAEPALLGHRRQRHQPHRRRGAPDQALRALLQGDRLRRHRGQEAHRPVVGAVDPRLRRRSRGLDRRRRRQGDRDLPGPQGHPDRDRQRRRGAVRGGPPGARRPRRPPAAWVRAVGDGGPPLRIRGSARHRCAGPSPPRGARRDRRSGGRRIVDRRRRAPALAAPAAHRGRAELLRRAAQRQLRRPPRSEHRRAAGVVVPLRDRHRLARRLPGRARTHRHAGGRGRRPHRRAHRRASRSSPDRSTPSSTRPRRSPSASPGATRRCSSRRWCRPCSRRARPATASPTRRCARSPTSTPRSQEVTGWIRYEIDGDPEDGEVPVSVVDRGGIALDIPSRTERAGVLRGTKHTVALERQVFVTRGREDGRTVVIVPETKDDRATGLTLLHVRFHEHLSVAAARGALAGLPQPVGRPARRRARDRAHVPRGPAHRGARRRPARRPRSPSWPTGGARTGAS